MAGAGAGASPAGAVTGGIPGPAHAVRSAAFVISHGRFCSGVLVAPRVVLLALHCAAERGSSVRVGNPNGGGLMQRRVVVEAVPAPQAQPPPRITGDTDVEAVVLDRAVAPAPVAVASAAEAAEFSTDGAPVIIAGFGEHDDRTAGELNPDRVRLREGGLSVASCYALVPNADGSPDVGCAAPAQSGPAPAGSPCAGDSGSPVLGISPTLGRLVLAGILSGGAGPQCVVGTAAIFTTLTPDLGWIASLQSARLPKAATPPRECRGDRRRLRALTRARHHRPRPASARRLRHRIYERC
jgi:secreted trypsin-like serine protease